MAGYFIPKFVDGVLSGKRWIRCDPTYLRLGNGSRAARRCMSEDDNKKVRKAKWGKRKQVRVRN